MDGVHDAVPRKTSSMSNRLFPYLRSASTADDGPAVARALGSSQPTPDGVRGDPTDGAGTAQGGAHRRACAFLLSLPTRRQSVLFASSQSEASKSATRSGLRQR
jgi:hypothetical protein